LNYKNKREIDKQSTPSDSENSKLTIPPLKSEKTTSNKADKKKKKEKKRQENSRQKNERKEIR